MKHVEQLHPILRELVEKGVPLTFTKDCIIVPGFYKSGDVKLWFQEDARHPESDSEPVLYARDRYGKETPISQLDDIVELNFYWWTTSKERAPGWSNPDPRWVPLLVEHGFVEVQEVRNYVPRVQR